jgi:hypothetical protein
MMTDDEVKAAIFRLLIESIVPGDTWRDITSSAARIVYVINVSPPKVSLDDPSRFAFVFKEADILNFHAHYAPFYTASEVRKKNKALAEHNEL